MIIILMIAVIVVIIMNVIATRISELGFRGLLV